MIRSKSSILQLRWLSSSLFHTFSNPDQSFLTSRINFTVRFSRLTTVGSKKLNNSCGGGGGSNSSVLINSKRKSISTVVVINMPVKKNTTELLRKLRELMKNPDLVKEPLAGYLIPSRDAHNSEYLAACDERRAFISGFDGSAGEALITETKALMWTDGRYHIQAAEQMDENWTLMKYGLPDIPTQSAWINQELPQGSLIGVDPRLYTNEEWKTLSKELEPNGNKLVPISENLVDLIWETRPQAPCNPVKELSIKFAGKSTKDKLADIRQELENKKAEYLVVSALDEIAWLLNWRGSDIPYNPVFFAYCIVGMDVLEIFIDSQKVDASVLDALNQQDKNVRFYAYDGIHSHLTKLVESNATSDKKIWFSKQASYYLTSTVPENKCMLSVAPIALMKIIKNNVEVQGMKECHIRDGAAVCQFFGWLKDALLKGEAVTEVSACTKLEGFRKKLPNFVGLSFPTIAGSGPNGAIIHYNPDSSPESRPLSLDEVFLVDSGGQFLDGTTDITRTVHFGTPTPFQKECYTRVLKGQIQLVNSIFPNKLVGNYLDSFARKALWEAGLDYLHGTGHGVGSYLNVHEGPSGISWRPYPDDPGLQENMFMSNEPGYYHTGEFGIRLENIIKVVKADPSYNFGNRGYLTFEDVTMVPFQRNMIDSSLLSSVEILYLNAYHTQCRKKVGDFMIKAGIQPDDLGYKWLIDETQAISGTPTLC